jgi:hypothetical protein
MNPIKPILCMLAGMLLATACTETVTETIVETIPAPELRGNRVLEFTVVNAPDPIQGVVNNVDTTITVYLPYYYFLKSMQAELTLPTGATVSPENGTLIDLSGMLTGNADLYYTVTAASGARAKYKVIFDTQQPVLEVNEVTTDPENPAEFTSSMLYLGKYLMPGVISLTGANFIRGVDGAPLSKVWFVSDTGDKIPAYGASSSGTTSLDVILPLYENIPAGIYHIQIDCYSYTIKLNNTVKIIDPAI